MKTWNHQPRWLLPLLGIGLLCVFATLAPVRAEVSDEEQAGGPVQVSKTANGHVVLRLDVETQSRIELAVMAVGETTFQPTVTAYGRLQPDPSRSFVLRAPTSGVLKASPEPGWPEIGSAVEAATILGYVEPRFTATEWMDLRARTLEAQAALEAVRAELEAARASYDSKRRLNTEHALVSERAIEETQARVESDEARLTAARQKVELYESLAKGAAPATVLFPIETRASGEVLELAARPGEFVDMGQVVLRTACFDTLLANVSLFVDDVVVSPVPRAQIVTAGFDGLVLPGEPVGPATEAGALTGGQALWFRIDVPARSNLRPGMAVEAHIPSPGGSHNGVLIPRSAVLRHAGRTWVYVKTGEERFERRAVMVEEPTAEGFIVSSGVSPGEEAVVHAAQWLLSEELKGQIESEEEAVE